MEYVSIGRILNSSLMFVGALYAIRCSFDVVGFAFVYFLVSLIVLGYSFVVSVWKFVKPRIEVDLGFWKATIKEALPFGLSSIFVIVYFYIDTVMLSLMKGDEVVGWYNAAYRLVYVLLFIPAAFFSSIYPVMSKLYTTSEDSLSYVYVSSLRYIAIVAYPIALGVTLFADKIILLIFKEEYQPSIPALRILIWAVFFSYLAHATVYTLNSINRQMVYTKVTFLGMIINVILNLIFIPSLSYVGASITTVITELVGFSLMFYYLGRYFGKSARYGSLARYVATLLLVSFIAVLMPTGVELTFTVTVGIYLITLWLLKVITVDDVNIIKVIFTKTVRR